MAIISKILALPSATQYEPSPPTIDGVIHFPSDFGSSTASNYFQWSSPSQTWKNKASASYRRLVESWNIESQTWTFVNDDFLNEFNLLQLTGIGARYRVTGYTRSNGSDVKDFVSVKEFYPQTKPNQSPIISGYYGNPYGVFVAWNAIETVSPNFSNNWGGAPATNVNGDRQYRVILEKMPGNIVVFDTVLPASQLEYTFGGYFNGTYRFIVYAKNNAGLSTFVVGSSTPTFSIVPTPPPPPYFGPYFGPGGGIY